MCSWVCVTPTRLQFDPKSWQNFIWALGLFAYEHPARSLCCHIKRKKCFLELLHVSTVDQYQIIVCSALLGQTGQSCGVFRSSMCWFSSVEQLVQLHRLFTFCVKGTLFRLCPPGKALHTESLGNPKAVTSLCASCTFYSISSAVLKGNRWCPIPHRSNFAALTLYYFALATWLGRRWCHQLEL